MNCPEWANPKRHRVDSWRPGAEERERGVPADEHGVSCRRDANALEKTLVGSCTAVGMYEHPLNCTL